MSKARNARRKQERQEQREYKKAAAAGLLEFTQGNELAGQIAGSASIVEEYRKLYNELCNTCKGKVVTSVIKTGISCPIEDYCPECRQRAMKRLNMVGAVMGLDEKPKEGPA